MRIERTEAKMGRSMKKPENIKIPRCGTRG